MAVELRWGQGSATAVTRIVEGVATVTFGGIFTFSAQRAWREDLLRRVGPGAFGVFLCRLDACAMAIPADQDNAAYLDALDESDPMLRPGAIVLRDVMVPMFKRHAWDAAARGVVRGVFGSSELAQAETWIALKAASFCQSYRHQAVVWALPLMVANSPVQLPAR